MRTILAFILCLTAIPAFSYPVTYLLYGETTNISVSSRDGNVNWDPNQPVSVDGQQMFNGKSVMIGSITIDPSLVRFHEDGTLVRSQDGGIVLDYQIATEGHVTYQNGYYPRTSQQYVTLDNGRFHAFDEVPGSTLPSPGWDRVEINLDFSDPNIFAGGLSDYFPLDLFLGGSFGLGSAHYNDARGNYNTVSMSGIITHMVLVDVPEPGTIGLLVAGLVGIPVSRRWASR